MSQSKSQKSADASLRGFARDGRGNDDADAALFSSRGVHQAVVPAAAVLPVASKLSVCACTRLERREFQMNATDAAKVLWAFLRLPSSRAVFLLAAGDG